MKFMKRFLPLMVVVALIFASCATSQVPTETEIPPVAPAQPQEQAEVAPEPQIQPQQPSVEKYVLQNLFRQANMLKSEATDFDLNSVYPDGFLAANNKHDAVAARYQELVDAPAEYDGVKAYPLKQDLEDLVAAWTDVVENGLPLRADAEKSAADEARISAMTVDAPTLASVQYDAGLQYYAQASMEYDTADFRGAIASYRLAAAAFESAAAAAQVNALREDIEKNDYAEYESIRMYFSMGEDKYREAQDLWQKGTLEDINASTAIFEEAKDYYSFVQSKGSELKALEGKDKTAAAHEEALKKRADVNAPDEYQQAMDILAEAEKNMNEGNYKSAYFWYSDATSAFEAALDVTDVKAQDAADAIAQAETSLTEAKDRASELGLEENIYLTAASEHLDKANTLKEDMRYGDALFEANEVFNYIGLSDNFVKEEAQIREKARLEQLEKDKAAADAALADAKARMAWADEVNLASDYPKEYTDAANAMAAAEKAYAIEKYVPAKTLAEEVSTTLSDQFQQEVLAAREAAKAKAAQADEEARQKALNKELADAALADAETRMAWANEYQVRTDYPDQYKEASVAMVGAYVAYGNEDYLLSKEKAEQVSAILSDDFQVQVASDRAAKEQLAKDKAVADEVLPKARNRMAWAEQANIMADYPNEYQAAAASMTAAEKAYGIEKYAPATMLANEVLSTLSSDFEAKVASERAAKEAAAAIAQNMKYAQTAIADAQSRYDWVASKNAANNYPELFKKGGEALADAKTAFNALDYTRAKDLAAQSYWTLTQIDEFAPLPASYVVRLIPERRDCLWRIAEYPFVYNNPYKWPVLYEANKATFKDPSNPDLIFPGQVLKIPSIKQELREGVWDPNKTYQPLAK